MTKLAGIFQVCFCGEVSLQNNCECGSISAWTCVQLASQFRVESMFLMSVNVVYYFLMFWSLWEIVQEILLSFPFLLSYSRISSVYCVKRSVSEALIHICDTRCCLKRTVLHGSTPNWIKSVISFWNRELKCKIEMNFWWYFALYTWVLVSYVVGPSWRK